MKSLIVYDTNYGHTRRVAEAVADGLGGRAVATAEVRLEELSGLDLLVAGSPIVGWKPTERMLAFLAELGRDRLKGVKAAAFDTRVKLFIHGDAAGKINRALEAAGAEIIEPPGFFYVKGKEGPLLEGELEKARAWAATLKTNAGV